MLKTPVLLIIFKRKETSLHVIRAIGKVKPKILYISQDGPRNINEEKEVLETRRAVLSEIKWNCKLVTLFHKKNLGFKKHIPEALSRFFKDNEYGIYLEDDTIPSKEFFYFEEELLKKYKNDNRIFAIDGTNLYPNLTKNESSYYLSQIGCIWGIGMWRRSWKLYHSEIPNLKSFKYSDYENFIFSKKFFIYLKFFLDLVNKNKLNAWDYQLTYAAIRNKKYFLYPSLNLVDNIGLNKINTNPFLQNYRTGITFIKSFKIHHPKQLIYSHKRDEIYFNKMYRFSYARILLNLLYFAFPDNFRKIFNGIVNKLE
ncbi:MAG: hypothetical protein ABSE04_03430 [Candidatus Microgenomates bacterium]|jgi:hypothetical protein